MIDCIQCTECEFLAALNEKGLELVEFRGPGNCPECDEPCLRVWLHEDVDSTNTLEEDLSHGAEAAS